ncbi:MAG: pantetheine-phosphate adenylyltransferase [Oscillospiraceae bacterium]
MSLAICPGSFDPVTNGHINIIERTALLFDEVIVLVLINSAKKCAFTADERVNMITKATQNYPNVRVESFDGLLADFAKTSGANTLVKGLRAVTDFEYEFQLSLINKKLNPTLETLLMPTDSKYMYLSSSMVKEVASYGGDIKDFVPFEILTEVKNKLVKDGKN